MQALVTTPGEPHSTHVEDRPEPTGDGVRVRVLEVGVCGTDREIDHGLFGAAAEGSDALVMGHEMLGIVDADGHGFSRGDLVCAVNVDGDACPLPEGELALATEPLDGVLPAGAAAWLRRAPHAAAD